jgi:two-component system, NarL family, sensor kinase
MTSALLYTRTSIGILCSLIFLLEIILPTEYVFGHLYVIPLLLTSFQLNRNDTSLVAFIEICLTVLDLIVPHFEHFSTWNFAKLTIYSLVNRVNVIVVLVIISQLIQRNLKYVNEIDTQNREITYHKMEMLAQLSLARMREDFVWTLTHDLKTPLLGAITTIESFQKQQFGAVNTTQDRVLTLMFQSQQKLLKLVETLLDIYRYDTDGLVLQYESSDLCALAQEAIDSIEMLGREHQVKFNLEYDRSARLHYRATVDPLQISRVFNNLLSNAIYHSPRGGRVDIILRRYPDRYVVRVIDRGRGIAAADLGRLFDRFYQAHQQIQGSGLGLYLSRQIVEAHGGKIWAESELNQGTKFYFSLPIGL